MMPGQAARGGQPSPRISQTAARTSEPASSRPRASAPGSKYRPPLRIATKADAHSTTVTDAAASARRSMRSAAAGALVIRSWGCSLFLTGTEPRSGIVQRPTKFRVLAGPGHAHDLHRGHHRDNTAQGAGQQE